MMKRIGLMGGTFDPVHIGHLSIASSFLSSNLINELWILLTPYPPHKNDKYHVDYNLRLEMVNATFEDLHNTSVLTIENELQKPSYTYRTIQYLKDKNPNTVFLYCMGEDSLSQFHTWKFHEDILLEANLLVAKRPGSDHKQVKGYILDQTEFVTHKPVNISSTSLKTMIANNENYEVFVHHKVKQIIEKEQLYV